MRKCCPSFSGSLVLDAKQCGASHSWFFVLFSIWNSGYQLGTVAAISAQLSEEHVKIALQNITNGGTLHNVCTSAFRVYVNGRLLCRATVYPTWKVHWHDAGSFSFRIRGQFLSNRMSPLLIKVIRCKVVLLIKSVCIGQNCGTYNTTGMHCNSAALGVNNLALSVRRITSP